MWINKLNIQHCTGNYWRLTAPLVYFIEIDRVPEIRHHFNALRMLGVDIVRSEREYRICVPEGFYTDLGSVHQSLWWFVTPWDIGRPAVIHDYLYSKLRPAWKENARHRHMYKKCADNLFRHALQDANDVSALKQYLVYSFVRYLGRISLDQNKRQE